MALITCTECGKKISDSVAVCPNCGKKIDVSECVTSEVGRKSRRLEKIRIFIIAAALCSIIVLLIIPKIFLRGLLNWQDHFTVEVEENSIQKVWNIKENDGRWLEDVTIHFSQLLSTHETIKFTIDEKMVYGNISITEKEIKQAIDDVLGENGLSDGEQIDRIYTKVEYITWKSVYKQK